MKTEILRTENQNVGDYTIVRAGTTDSRIVEMWIDNKRSPHTKALYRRAWRQFSADVAKPIQSVDFEDLQDWLQSIPGKPATVKVKVMAIKSLYAFAHRVGYIRFNPAAVITAPAAIDAKHKRILSESDIHQMLAAASAPRDRALIRVLYSAGARISEILALTWADVIPTDGGKADLMIVGKGSALRRSGISAPTHAALRSLRNGAGEAGPVFATRNGTHLDTVAAWRKIKTLAKMAGIDSKPSPHWFRHSHVSHALERGANPEAIRAQVGHASLKTTTTYAHSVGSSSDYLAI